jgi:hypothetical protein
VRQKLTTFAQVLGIGLLITDSSLGIAAPDAVPKLQHPAELRILGACGIVSGPVS